jgi:hypothetical protein
LLIIWDSASKKTIQNEEDSNSSQEEVVEFGQGFPVGLIGLDGRAYINNHVNIENYYHEDQHFYGKDRHGNRIVRFVVQPFSIGHEFDFTRRDDEGRVATILNPLESCDTRIPYTKRNHTNLTTVTAKGPQSPTGIWKSAIYL